LCITNTLLGILKSPSLRPSAVGRGLAEAKSLCAKHTIKQVDRLLSDDKFPFLKIQHSIVNQLLSNKKEILVAMDWTCFARDNQITLTLRHVTNHGRAIPLLWLSVYADELKGPKIDYENQLLSQLYNLLSDETRVVILADREFGSIKRFKRLKKQYSFEYVIRFRINTYITNVNRDSKKALDWLGANYQNRTFNNSKLTLKEYPIPKIVVSREKI